MPTPLRKFLAPLACLGALLIAGCNLGPVELSGLVVHIEGVRAFESTDGQSSITVTARCYNETIRPIGIKSVDATLTLNGITIGSVHSDKPLGTQALSSNTVDVTFPITSPDVAARLKAALKTGALNYELKSRLTVFSGDDEMRGTSTTTGSFEVNPHLLNLD